MRVCVCVKDLGFSLWWRLWDVGLNPSAFAAVSGAFKFKGFGSRVAILLSGSQGSRFWNESAD